jgi:hypothetical protein
MTLGKEADMRIAADGFIDVRDGRRVRTPGHHSEEITPVPEGEALAFLLSHSFPGHRRVVRGLTEGERRRIRLAMWADSVSERMALVDRIWRGITEAVLPPAKQDEPELLQVVHIKGWAFPIYLDGACTRVIPTGGLPLGEVAEDRILHLEVESA